MLSIAALVLIPLVIGALAATGIALAVIKRVRPENRTTARISAGCLILALVGGYVAFVVRVAQVHLDTADLIAPSPDSRLEHWRQACATSMSVGRPMSDVFDYLSGRGVVLTKEESGQTDDRLYFRFRREDGVARIDLVDQNVLNWDLFRDYNVIITVSSTEDVVTSCSSELRTSNR